MKKKQKSDRALECVQAFRDTGDLTDPLGSYTGIFRTHDASMIYPPCAQTLSGKQRDDLTPVQDADDL